MNVNLIQINFYFIFQGPLSDFIYIFPDIGLWWILAAVQIEHVMCEAVAVFAMCEAVDNKEAL